jgi:glycosidase
MLWSDAANAGFSEAEPWLPLSPNWPEINADRQANEPGSTLTLYRRLLALRRRHPALHRGAYRTVATADGVLAYEREHADERLLVVLNMTPTEQDFALPAGDVLLDSADTLRHAGGAGRTSLQPGQALIVLLKASR